MTEGRGNDKGIHYYSVLRWIAVVPGALLAVVAAMFPWHWVVLIYANVVDQESLGLGLLVRAIGPEDVERAGYGFLTPLVLVSVSARIAPRFKQATAVVMSFIVVAIWAFFWTVGRSLLNQQGVSVEVIQSLVGNGLAIVAIWVVWRYARPWWDEMGEGRVAIGR